jgi:dipeptidyl aminopeptidase/acylaminoacyl peptidase
MVARSRTLADPRWSPDGRLLAWVDSFSGRADLVVAPADGSGPSAVVTADVPLAKSGSPFAWVGDEIVYAARDGRLVAIPATGGLARVLSRDGRAAAPAVSPDGTRVAFVLERDDACDIAAVPTDGSAWPVRISTGADWAFDPAWAADGRALAWHEWDFPDMPWDGSRIVLRPVDGYAPAGLPLVVEGGDGVSVGQPRFSPDGSALGFVHDRSGFANLWVAGADGAKPQPVLEEPFEHAEPTWGPGQRSFAWSPDGTAIAICRNEAGFGRLVVSGAEEDFRRPWRQEPARRPWRQEPARRPWRQATEVSKGWHHGLDWGTGGIACVRSGARTSPGVTILTADGAERRVLAQGAPASLEAAGPIEPEAVTWTGDDGVTVHGLLYRPPEANPPLLVYVHGGPTGTAAATWWPRHQFWVSRGWAVLAPNYRGSTGYGRSYTQALTGKWGEIDVADVVAGIRHAGKEGWGDPARVALDGGSAGGFTVLLVCAHHPGLVRAAVARYAVADLFHLAETTHRYESRYLDRIVGPLPEAADRYRECSPVNLVERIGVPLLVLQGDADEVVPKAQADALVEGLRRRNVPVEYHVYEGEGHGWSGPEAVADELERAEAFLTRWVLRR